jgi:hypothetical protein
MTGTKWPGTKWKGTNRRVTLCSMHDFSRGKCFLYKWPHKQYDNRASVLQIILINDTRTHTINKPGYTFERCNQLSEHVYIFTNLYLGATVAALKRPPQPTAPHNWIVCRPTRCNKERSRGSNIKCENTEERKMVKKVEFTWRALYMCDISISVSISPKIILNVDIENYDIEFQLFVR